MKGDIEGDAHLEEGFARLKAEDAARAPDFSAMIAQARSVVHARSAVQARSVVHARSAFDVRTPETDARTQSLNELQPAATHRAAPRVEHVSRSIAPRHALRWAIPLAVAAGLAAIAYLPRQRDRVADREFDRLVSEWSRTSDATRNAPTDGLLATPAIGLMQNLPAIGSGVGAPRGRS